MRKISNGSASFVLIICIQEFLSFSNLNSEEFIHTVKAKEIKFTHVAEKQKSNKIKFFQKINTVSENIRHGWTVYWDPGKINKPENSKNNLNFGLCNSRWHLANANMIAEVKSKIVSHRHFLVNIIFSATLKVQIYQNKTGEKFLCSSKCMLATYFKNFKDICKYICFTL